MGADDFAWADGLRRTHFPPERNVLRAHLTMFHHIAPSLENELCQRLIEATRQPAPKATLAGVLNLGRGVAYRVESMALESIRHDLAEAFLTMLIPQDRAPWRAHVTVQNKVDPAAAKALLTSLSIVFAPRPFVISGLAVYRYMGGPWAPVGAWRFGNGHRMSSP
jgi:2'-5' RNA ligase superfamily